MPAYLPNSCSENAAGEDSVDSESTDTQNITLSFPGCPSNSAEICMCFEELHDLNSQNSSSKATILETNLQREKGNPSNDLDASKPIENNLEITSKGCLGDNSELDNADHVTHVDAIDKVNEKCKNVVHSSPLFARCSSQDAATVTKTDGEQQLSTSPRRVHNNVSPNQSFSLNWASGRKKALDGGRDDNASSYVVTKAKPRGQGHKYKPEARSFEDCVTSNAGIPNSSSVFYQESYYTSSPRETLCGESAQGDTRAIQKNLKKGAENNDEELPNEDTSKIKYGNIDIDVPTVLEKEQTFDFQEAIPLPSPTSNAHRSPPHVRSKFKDHRLIDRMFIDVLKLLVDNGETDLPQKSTSGDEMELKDRKTFVSLNQTANHEQRESVIASTSHTDCSISQSFSAGHNMSEEDLRDSPSIATMSSFGQSELNMLQYWTDDDDEYECPCCKIKNQYYSQDNNNCHYIYEDSNDESSEHWDCLDSASSSGGSSRESLRSSEGANVNVEIEQSSESRTSKRPSVRELVRSLQEKFSACTNPRPSVKHSLDILPEWQFTCHTMSTNASISQATSSSHQDDLLELHSPETSTDLSLSDVVYSSQFAVQPGIKLTRTASGELVESKDNDKVYFSKSSDSPDLRKERSGFPFITKLKRKVRIPKDNNETVLVDISLSTESSDENSSDNDTVLLGEESKTCRHVKQFLQTTDQPVVVSRKGTPFVRSHVFDDGPRSFQDTTGDNYLHSRLSFFLPSDDQSTDPHAPEVAQHLSKSNDNLRHEQTSEDRLDCCQHPQPGMSTGTGDKCSSREKRWGSLLGANSCLGKMKATISRVRAKSVSPLITKIGNVFERMKDAHASADKSSSVSGILEENSFEQTHIKVAKTRLLDNRLQQLELSTISSQTTDEPDLESVNPVQTGSATSGDDHPPIFCLEINRTASVRKSDKQQSRHQKCSIVTRDSKRQFPDSANTALFMERNELTKIQQTVLYQNLDGVKECINYNPSFNKDCQKFITKDLDISMPRGRSNTDTVIEDTILKPDILASFFNFEEMKVRTNSVPRPPCLTSVAENSDTCGDAHSEEAHLRRHQRNQRGLDVEPYSVKELFEVLETQDNPPADLKSSTRPFSSPTNYERELADPSLPNAVFWSAPEKSYSWVNASEAVHTESCITEVMAIVSEEIHIKRYPSFPDLTNLNSDLSAVLSTKPSETVHHSCLNEVHNDATGHGDISESLHLSDQSNDCMLETATSCETIKCSDSETAIRHETIKFSDSNCLKDNKAYLNGSAVKMAENGILRDCLDPRFPENENNELGNTLGVTHCEESDTIYEHISEAIMGVSGHDLSFIPRTDLEDGCEILNFPKIYTDFSSLLDSVDIEQRATDNILTGIYLLSPPRHSLSENSWGNDACASQRDKSIKGPTLGVINNTDIHSADLPSPPDDSLSDNSWDNVFDAKTGHSAKDMQASVADTTSFQSTSNHTGIMSPSSVHNKRLQLLRAAVTQDYGHLADDLSFEPSSFGASSDSFSSEKKQRFDDRNMTPVICSQGEDSQSSEPTLSSLSYTDLKETHEDHNLHLYVVDIFRDFRNDTEHTSANGNSDTALRENQSSSLGNLVLEPKATSEGYQDYSLGIPNPSTPTEKPEASPGFVQMIYHNLVSEKGSDVVGDNIEESSVMLSILAVSSASEHQGESSSENPCRISGRSESYENLLHDDDNWNTLVSKTHPKTIDKVLKSHSQLSGSCTSLKNTPSESAIERDEMACSCTAGDVPLNKQPKQIRWLDNVNLCSVVEIDRAHYNTFSDSCLSGHCSSLDREDTALQKDTVLDLFDNTSSSSYATTKGNSSS